MKEIYSSKISGNSRTYFINVKVASNNSKYLDFVETRKRSENTFERHNVMIFENDIKEIIEELNKIYNDYFKDKSDNISI